MGTAEAELCGIFDKVEDDGSPCKDFCGRGEGLKVVRGKLCGHRAGWSGRVDDATLGLLWFRRALGDIVFFLSRFINGTVPPMMAKQWAAIRSWAERPNHFMQALFLADGRWKHRADAIAILLPGSRHRLQTIKDWMKDAYVQVRSRSVGLGKVARQNWFTWVEVQLQLGAGPLHRFTKREFHPPAVLTVGPNRPAVGVQAMLDADRQSWKAIWDRFEQVATAPWREVVAPPSWAPALPSLSGSEISLAASKFKRTTGLGVDAFSPRWFCQLSEGLLQGFAELLMAIERLGAWPVVLRTLLIVQIPKADGGRRPIGLLPTLVRVWEKLRKPIVASWRQTICRSYNYADKGKSAQLAVWKQALCAEAAVADGGHSAAVLVDLAKAFEQVSLDLVWRAGLKLHCPPGVLRLELEAFAMKRRLTMQGAVSAPVETLSAILAGGSFATDALFMLMLGPCDQQCILTLYG